MLIVIGSAGSASHDEISVEVGLQRCLVQVATLTCDFSGVSMMRGGRTAAF